MKKNKQYFLQLILLLVACISFTGCTADSGNDNEDTGGNNGNNNLKTGQVQIKANPSKYNLVRFMVTAKKVTVDWGDGQIDEITTNNVEKEFKHEYPNKNLQVVTIKTDNMTSFWDGGTERSYYSEIKFGDCPNLESLSVAYQTELTVLELGNLPKLKILSTRNCRKLSSLNLKGCPSISNIQCVINNLSESALNQIFKDLPKTNGVIDCRANLGWETCDKSIAINKGWTVVNN